jgi:hypothetical protein
MVFDFQDVAEPVTFTLKRDAMTVA